jgi:hypothetical protein
MNTLRDFVSRNLHGNMPERIVKVALIDDGVDVNTPCLRGKIKCGWPNEPPTSVSVPWYQSFGGHGTAMAHLITAACPNVEFYVVQLKTFNVGDQHSDSACKNAAEEATEVSFHAIFLFQLELFVFPPVERGREIVDLVPNALSCRQLSGLAKTMYTLFR